MAKKKIINPKKKVANDAAGEQQKMNDKGEITSWSASSDDGKLLKMLVENGCITMKMTAGQARDKYQMYNKYAYGTFSSALTNVKKSFEKEIDSRGNKNAKVKNHRNDDEEYEEEYEDDFEEEEDLDYASVGMSRMSIAQDDDDITIDTRRSHGKSVSFSVRSGMSNLKPSRKTVSGVAIGKAKGSVGMAVALPYVIDYWHDKSPRQRASIQIQMLSGDAMQLQRVSYRVSTGCDEFVVSLPKSRYMGSPKAAFETYVLSTTNDEEDKERHQRILEYHPKSAARRLQIVDINKGGNVMELRIKLRHKFSLDFASVASNDPYFYGDKFVTYPDGTTHLIVELVSEDDKHSSPAKASAPMFHVPGSVNVPSVGDDDDMSISSRMDQSMTSRRSMKSTRTSASGRSRRSSHSSRSVPIINTGRTIPNVATRATKFRKSGNGERTVAETVPETESEDASL